MIAESFSTALLKNPSIGISSAKLLGDQSIRKYIEQYDEFIYYDPFTMLCQSSGFGKSRACFGLVDEGFYVVYCCLRDEKSSGYPKRSVITDVLLNISYNTSVLLFDKKFYILF